MIIDIQTGVAGPDEILGIVEIVSYCRQKLYQWSRVALAGISN